jgi:hypothetical protein
MHIYSVSPDLFKNNKGFDDEYDNWLYGCFKSKWNHRREDFEIEDDELDNFVPEPLNSDVIEHNEFNPIILKEE